ncbi:hypothetical protein HMPREF9567_00796 [Cutibacterium acnes HL013PA1]|nr:hypothetical protein HMPREF9567_00796 [Cutibacterium acnes HL013PA1]
MHHDRIHLLGGTRGACQFLSARGRSQHYRAPPSPGPGFFVARSWAPVTRPVVES